MVKKASREILYGSITHLWRGLFYLAGFTRQRTIATWDSPGEQSVLVLATHPDDEVIGCGGTIIRHLDAGDRVEILYITDGRRSKAQRLRPEEMATRRFAEARAALEIVGATESCWLGLPEGEWQAESLMAALAERITPEKFGIIYAPSPIDYHPDHIKTANVLAKFFDSFGLVHWKTVIRVFQVHVPLTPVLINLVSPLNHKTFLKVTDALAAYKSQTYSIRQTLRLRVYDRSYQHWDQPIEVFWEVSAEDFSGMRAAVQDPIETGKFFGIRPRPMSDPLAYMIGYRARKKLAIRLTGRVE